MIGEVSRALCGVWRFVQLDPVAGAYFGSSLAAARRSFVVAALVAPLFVLQAFIDFDALPDADPWVYVVVQVASYVIMWTAWPVLLASLAPQIGCAERYGAYIAASNWFVLVEFALLFPITAFEALSFLPDLVVAQAQLAVEVGVLFYGWFIAKNILKVSSIMAVALVMIEFLLMVLIALVAHNQL